MTRRTVSIALALLALASCALAAPTLEGPLPGPLPLLPADNWWNLDVTNAPVDPNSGTFITFIGPARGCHPDFGGDVSAGSVQGYGFPYVVGILAVSALLFGLASRITRASRRPPS